MSSPLAEGGLASAQRFESDVGGFLEDLGLRHVASGQRNVIGGVQVDASGAISDCFVAVECHTSVEARRKPIRRKIKEHRGILQNLRDGLLSRGWAKKYPKIRLVVATKNINVSRADRAFAAQRPRVFLWDDEFLDYYRKEIDKVGPYAIKEVLGELSVTFPPAVRNDEHCIPAFRTKLRGRVAYSFFARPEALLDIAFVARRERGTETYYQRFLKKDRIVEIGKFLRDRRQQNFFANNIIISFRDPVRFVRRKRFGLPGGIEVGWLYLPTRPRSAWIIDGQHRLYGFTKARAALQNLRLPVVAFSGLDEGKQAELFLTINKEQKPVDPNLLWDLEGEIHPATEVGIISRAVKSVGESSPFIGRIFVPLKGSGRQGKHVYLANFCDSVEARDLVANHTENMKATVRNPLYRRVANDRVRVLSRALSTYFTQVSRLFVKDWRRGKKGFIFTNNGINVMLRIYEQGIVYLRHTPKASEIRRLLQPLKRHYQSKYSTIDAIDELRSACNGEGGRATTAFELMSAIQGSFPGYAASAVTRSSPRDVIADFESKVRTAVVEHMQRKDPNWWIDPARMPPHLRTRAEGRSLAVPGSPQICF